MCVDDVDGARLEPAIHLSDEARQAVRTYEAARSRSEREAARLREVGTQTIDFLTGTLDLSVRDVADLLGISHQRVQQVASGART